MNSECNYNDDDVMEITDMKKTDHNENKKEFQYQSLVYEKGKKSKTWSESPKKYFVIEHESMPTVVMFNKTSKLLFTSLKSGKTQMWNKDKLHVQYKNQDLSSMKHECELELPNEKKYCTRSASLSPINERVLLLSGESSNVYVWDLEKMIPHTVESGHDKIFSSTFLNNSRYQYIQGTSTGIIESIDLKFEGKCFELSGHRNTISKIKNYDEYMIVSSDIDGLMNIWDMRMLKLLTSTKFDNGIMTFDNYECDLNRFVIGMDNSTISIFNAQKNEIDKQMQCHAHKRVLSVRTHRSGWFCSGGLNGKLLYHGYAYDDVGCVLSRTISPILSIDISNSGNYIACSSKNNTTDVYFVS